VANEKIARATIVLYDGAEQPVAEEFDVLLEIRNNYGVNQSTWVKGPVVQLNLQFFNGRMSRSQLKVGNGGWVDVTTPLPVE
jgi:hypothetical protein